MVYLSGSDLNVSVWIDPGGIRSTASSDGAAAYRYVPQHDHHYDHREFGFLVVRWGKTHWLSHDS